MLNYVITYFRFAFASSARAVATFTNPLSFCMLSNAVPMLRGLCGKENERHHSECVELKLICLCSNTSLIIIMFYDDVHKF